MGVGGVSWVDGVCIWVEVAWEWVGNGMERRFAECLPKGKMGVRGVSWVDGVRAEMETVGNSKE